jgi:hexosaminidase
MDCLIKITQGGSTMATLLIPQPKVLVLLDGSFTINENTQIVIPAQAGDESFLAANQLQNEIAGDEDNAAPPIVKAFGAPRSDNIILLLCGPEQANRFGISPMETNAPDNLADQSYSLTVTPAQIVLYADTDNGLYYAAQTLRQLLRVLGTTVPAQTIRDWPSLAYRGLMLDISRHKVPTLNTLMQLVEELSHYKLNVLQLYTEHTFHFPRHPKIGAGCGSLSSEDILTLDVFCRAHHIELMPNLQSFGHARGILTIPEYQHLAETDALWTLSPAFEETYALLDELFADMLPAFTSQTFNVDCDETYDVGKGASKELADEIGVGRVYLNHVLRVRELAAGYGCSIQAWGDILLHHPELISEVPDDVTLLDWGYAPADEYPTVKMFSKAGRRFWVCPGVGSWNSIFPRLYDANTNIRNYVRDGIAAGAEGMLNTDWGDAGHYQPLGLSWYGYVFGAAQGWSGGATSDEDFYAAFGPLFFGPDHRAIMASLHELARTNELPNIYRPNRSHSVLALFDEPLTGSTVEGDDALPPETLKEMQSLSESASVAFDVLAPRHPRELTLHEMGLAARLTAYAARKTALAQLIRADLRAMAAKPEPVEANAARLYEHVRSLKALDVELDERRREFEEIWLARARPSEIHFSLSYFASLRIRYRAAMAWLIEQRGSLLAGKPVDVDLSTYDAGDHRVLWHTWYDRSTW